VKNSGSVIAVRGVCAIGHIKSRTVAENLLYTGDAPDSARRCSRLKTNCYSVAPSLEIKGYEQCLITIRGYETLCPHHPLSTNSYYIVINELQSTYQQIEGYRYSI
jgi:hypothetical protein